ALISSFFHHRTGRATMRDKTAHHKRGKNPVCIVFDYFRTLAQKEFPVGLRSWLMRKYGDDAAHDVSGLNTFIR
ncbi:hypothetical protein, partial [Escherichia coli]|uniref:hypothetical protein n=2 Tax=Escherichia coli TaxID=562 RepID=UPI001BFC4DF8